MSTTKKLIGIGLLAIAMMAIGTGTASADDYQDDNQIEVDVEVGATSREGSIFGYRRTFTQFDFHGAEYAPAGSTDDVFLTYVNGCSGNYAFDGQAFTTERRSDGAVRVSLIVWTWDGQCGYSGQHGAWGQRWAWVEPNETATIVIHVGSRGGSTRAVATFTNHWNPIESDFISTVEVDNVLPEEPAEEQPVIVIKDPVFLDPSLWNGVKLPDFTKLITLKADF